MNEVDERTQEIIDYVDGLGYYALARLIEGQFKRVNT